MLGGLDVLVNNAGIGMRTVNPRFMTEPQPFWEVPPAGFRDVLETKATGTFLVAREVVPRMLSAGGGRVVTISMSEQTMTRRGFIPYGPSGAAVEALARVMAADLADTPVTANILLPGGATATGMIPDEMPDELRANLLDPAIMGPPIVWLASADAAGVHDERIVARDFDDWLGGAREEEPVTPEELANLAHLRRARDLMDREYARPLDVAALARAALMSTAHFSRQFRAAYGETPYAYLMTRRIERAKALLRRGDLSVTEVCMAVGCTSLGSFSARFTQLVGETPTAYRARDHSALASVPGCVAKDLTRPSREAEQDRRSAAGRSAR